MRISAEARKKQLISATVEIMRREGVQSVTVRAIAKEADAPLAAAHYCFSSKDDLMDAAAEAWFKHMGHFSSDVQVNSGLRSAVEQVAEGYWRSLEEEPANLLAQIELILWATRNTTASALAEKIYPDYEVSLGGIFLSATENAGEECLISFDALARSFLMIFDGAAIQYMTDQNATDHRAHFFMMVDALLIKAGV